MNDSAAEIGKGLFIHRSRRSAVGIILHARHFVKNRDIVFPDTFRECKSALFAEQGKDFVHLFRGKIVEMHFFHAGTHTAVGLIKTLHILLVSGKDQAAFLAVLRHVHKSDNLLERFLPVADFRA